MRTIGESRRLDAAHLLREVRKGDDNAADRLMSILYGDLRRLVRGVMAGEGRHHALHPASVVNEAFVGLVQLRSRRSTEPDASTGVDWQSRAHFLALATRQMRLVLAEYAQAWNTRAGCCLRIALQMGASSVDHDYGTIDQFLKDTTEIDSSIGRLAQLDFLGGMNDRDIAWVEHISTSEVKRCREIARHWLVEYFLVSKTISASWSAS